METTYHRSILEKITDQIKKLIQELNELVDELAAQNNNEDLNATRSQLREILKTISNLDHMKIQTPSRPLRAHQTRQDRTRGADPVLRRQ